MMEKITVLEKYLDFTNVFLKKLVDNFQEYIKINKYALNLIRVNHFSTSLFII